MLQCAATSLAVPIAVRTPAGFPETHSGVFIVSTFARVCVFSLMFIAFIFPIDYVRYQLFISRGKNLREGGKHFSDEALGQMGMEPMMGFFSRPTTTSYERKKEKCTVLFITKIA